MQNEKDRIEAVVRTYFEGFNQLEASLLEKAFHPEAKLHFESEGALGQTPATEWFDRVRARKAAGNLNPSEPSIESIDVTGSAASVKTRLDYPAYQFIDYLSLLKLGDEWKIVNKIYTVAEKAPVASS